MLAALFLGARGSAAPPPFTAGQALAASRAATSIGPDPCRNPNGDEIVVCGIVTNPYEVPLYAADAASQDGRGTAAGNLVDAGRTFAPCRARGEPCIAPLPVLTIPVGKGKKSGIKVGKD